MHTLHLTKFDTRVSRRKAILNYALPIALLPIITSVLTPTAAQAQSVACPENSAPCIDTSICNTTNSGQLCINAVIYQCACFGFVCNSGCCNVTAVSIC